MSINDRIIALLHTMQALTEQEKQAKEGILGELGIPKEKDTTNTKKENMPQGTVQDRVNQYMISEAKADLNEQLSNHKVELDKTLSLVVHQNPGLLTVEIPQSMNKLQAAFSLIKQFEEEEALRTYNRTYDNFFVNDFMINMELLVKKYFGMLHVSKINTLGKPVSSDYIQFPVGFDSKGMSQVEKGYIGSIKAPVWEDAIIDINPNCSLAVKAKLKFEKEVNTFLQDVEESMRRRSVIKGTSVKLHLLPTGRLMAEPILVKENKKIVLSPDVKRIVNNLIIPSLKQPGKSSLLFTGDFGTGKTETALKVGHAAQQRFQRTFFYLQNSDMFGRLIPYIKNYQSAIIFTEDIDQVSSGDRDSNMNNLLNQLDGNELKNVSATFIFTTNDHDKIHPAMRRPGRIDQIVHFDYCTPEVIAEIFEVYSDEMTGAENVDYLLAAKDCPPDLQGAVVAEIARRAVMYAENFHEGVISTDRFMDSIASMRFHIEFMRKTQKKDHTAENLLGHLFYKSMKKAFPNMGSGTEDWIGSTYEGLDS